MTTNEGWCPAANAVLAWMQRNAIVEERHQRAKIQEAASRCGITDLKHLTNEQQDQIMTMLKVVEKEWAEAKAKSDAEHKARLAQLRAETQKEYDKIAAPYREQRRLARQRTLLAQKGIL